MASLTSSSTPTPSSASSYNLVVLNNRQVTITKFNTTENETEINEINQFNAIMKSGRTSNLGLVGVSNRPLTIKKMQEDWIKINKAIPQSTTEYKPEDFDFKKAADTNVNTYLIRVNKNLDKMILWLQTFVDRYGALEAAKTLAIECDVALTPMHINRSATLQKLEMMNIRYNAANQLHLTDDTKKALFRGTLKSKIKILKKSTASAKAAGKGKSSLDQQAHRLHQRELDAMTKWQNTLIQEYSVHPYVHPTLNQVKQEVIDAVVVIDEVELISKGETKEPNKKPIIKKIPKAKVDKETDNGDAFFCDK